MIVRYLKYRLTKRSRSNRYIPTKPPYTHCKNCGNELYGKYCSVCGQHAIIDNQMFRDSVVSYFENNYSFDSKLWKTLGYLFSRPGYLSREFMNGRIVRYVHPFKLYFFSSILLFGVVVSTTTKIDDKKPIFNANTTESGSSNQQHQAALKEKSDNHAGIKVDYDAQAELVKQQVLDSVQAKGMAKVKETNEESKFEKSLNENLSKMSAKEFVDKLYRNISLSMLVLMPVFALLLLLFYHKKDRRYVSHLIHSVHLHITLFLSISAVALFEYFTSIEGSYFWLFVVWLVYFAFSLSRFYEERKRKSILKGAIILTMYFFVSIISIVILVLLAVLL